MDFLGQIFFPINTLLLLHFAILVLYGDLPGVLEFQKSN